MGPVATTPRTRRPLAALATLATLAALIALPGSALARTALSGGAGIGVTGGSGASLPVTTTPDATTPSTSAPGSAPSIPGIIRLGGPVSASGDGITVTVASSGTQGRPLTITGEAPPTEAGALIEIETARPNLSSWTEVTTTLIGPSGSFSARWRPQTSAQVAIRAVLAPGIAAPTGNSTSGGGGLPGADSAATAATVLATSALTIPIFRSARATIYGPGFWGHRTACGERLRRTTLGIASRTLRCGTRVAVDFRGREITVPVIDRGPFAHGARWDLTFATARALGVRGTTIIGTLSPAPASGVAARG